MLQSCKSFFSYDLFNQQPVHEEPKKELSDKDVQMGFDITLTKHKGQVNITDNLSFLTLELST